MIRRTIVLMLFGTLLLSTSTLENIKPDISLQASFYSNRFEGRKCANGEVFRQKNLTAAYNSLPLNTNVLVTRIIGEDTYKVQVRITDRTHKRFAQRIDLSRSAAQRIKLDKEGIADVTVKQL